MRMPLAGAVLVLIGWLACTAAQAQEENAVVRRATDLREQPGDARPLAALASDTTVMRLAERQGPWVRVRTTAGLVGWVHMFDLGAQGSATPGASGAATSLLRGVTGLFGRPQPAAVSTSAIGIRGLGAQDLAQAQPDASAVTRMEALRASEPQARQFARKAGLAATPVEPLPAVFRAPGDTSSGVLP